jgi:mRNA interferase MazF
MLIKQKINNNAGRPIYYEWEIWWCSVGSNVGYEADGKGRAYVRPILIVKGFNKAVFWGIPMTTKIKTGKYYFNVALGDGTPRQFVLSQLRLIDGKRLYRKMGAINGEIFIKIKQAIADLLLQ